MIALKARVPVIPCYIEGAPTTARHWARSSCGPAPGDRGPANRPEREYYGRDSDKEALGELTLRFLTEIARLAKNDSFQPRLAGRKWGFDGTDSEHHEAEAGTDSKHSPAGRGSEGPSPPA